jgi:hypothetical protein
VDGVAASMRVSGLPKRAKRAQGLKHGEERSDDCHSGIGFLKPEAESERSERS